ncbi:MAG: DNA polymerase IV [Turicibacter sp.]|nr:DNA polymerase IV [Turicibacter sp.]
MSKSNARKILHVDMDAFYAAVEMRDNPELKGKPLIIGSLPGERGVVATCNYKAREFGVRSAMPVAQAYKLCPHGHYMYPNMRKYQEASYHIHQIWATYTDIIEYISLDEGFLDVTASEMLFGSAQAIAREIKERTWRELGLTCSVGLGYSMSSAKLASEEKKPNGYFEILTPAAMRELIAPRSVRIVYTVGAKTAERLERIGVRTVADIYSHAERVANVLGNHGSAIVDLARGVDDRAVGTRTRGQSIGTEQTFQTDITDLAYLKDVLRLIARKLSYDIQKKGLYARTVTLKVTYPGMRSITRAKTAAATNVALDIYHSAEALFDQIEKDPIRLIGITVSNFTKDKEEKPQGNIQLSLFDEVKAERPKRDKEKLGEVLLKLQQEHGQNILKSASELAAEQHVGKKGSEKEKRRVVSSYARALEDEESEN